tara:strand:+ start:129 stop:401 length:273 start_codon:yes stop_codon:yes gene_type:complete
MDKKQKKSLRRAAKKKKDKAVAQENKSKMKKKMGMFDRLPNKCSACEKEFPKTREAHMTWQVVVKTQEQKVWLYCPSCQEKMKGLENAKS